MKKNICSYTDNGNVSPGFISINEEDDGRITAVVRSNVSSSVSFIVIPREDFENMAQGINDYLKLPVPVTEEKAAE